MARRIEGTEAGLYVPGLRDALATYWHRMDARFSGVDFGKLAAIAEDGRAVIVSYDTLFLSCYPAGLSDRLRHLDRKGQYLVTSNADVLVRAPVERVLRARADAASAEPVH